MLFGVTGDLAKRKLLPGLYHLYLSGLMPTNYRIIGTAPIEFASACTNFVDYVKETLIDFGRKEVTDDKYVEFANVLSFVPITGNDFLDLGRAIRQAKNEIGGSPNVIFYLAVPSQAFTDVIEKLGTLEESRGSRLIIEKPFGRDLSSAKKLNKTVHKTFTEENVYRIDHFLGKESVQNILALRFANGIFEPAWDRETLDHIQIDVPETLSVAGRGGFYEETGAFRDMIVTHLLQVLGFIAMDPPPQLDAKHLNSAREDVFKAIRPITKDDVIYGQYEGYLNEVGVSKASTIETFVAARVWIDSPRWNGIPFYLRTGKMLKVARSVITLAFKTPTVTKFPEDLTGDHQRHKNELTIEFGDPGSITIDFLAKQPGATMDLTDAQLRFSFSDGFNLRYDLEAYERLLHDVMIGDKTLFNSASGIEKLWEISEPLLLDPPLPCTYNPGEMGPSEADALIAPNSWHLK